MQPSASKSWTNSPRNETPGPCCPTLAHSWIGEGTQSTDCLHKWNMNMQRDPLHSWKFPALSQYHYKVGESILQALRHPPHIPVRLYGDNDSDPEKDNTWWPEREQWSMPNAWSIQATYANSCNFFGSRKWSQLRKRYTSLKRKHIAEAHCGKSSFPRGSGALHSTLRHGLQPLRHSLTSAAWTRTSEGFFNVCVELKRRSVALKK